MAMVHGTADVSPESQLGSGTRIWHHVHVREGARLGRDCILGKGVYVDRGVRIGDRVKIQNGALIYRGATLEDGVFVGPLACLANDRTPRAITPEGELKGDEDWEVAPTIVHRGASIGAGAIVLPGSTIGEWAMIAAGAVVTRDVPSHALVSGTPARLVGRVCVCGSTLRGEDGDRWRCERCGRTFRFETGGD